jgi:hypothetical protein
MQLSGPEIRALISARGDFKVADLEKSGEVKNKREISEFKEKRDTILLYEEEEE